MVMIDNLIMPDYSLGKIYKLVSQSGLVYIGSTTLSLHDRLTKHKYHHKQWKAGKFNYLSSFEVIDDGDATIIQLEKYPCETRKELEQAERKYIESNKCVNKNIVGRTCKEYYEDNKDKIKHYVRQYYGENKDVISAKHKQYRETNKAVIDAKNTCDCGGNYTHKHKSTHFKTNKHKQFIESL